MNLHIISESAYSRKSPFQALPLIGSKDHVLFINDGCYNLTHANFIIQLTQCTDHISALKSDLSLRGVNAPDNVQQVDMPAFVELSFKAKHIMSWS